MHTSAPLPSVRSWIASTGSTCEASTVWVAPNCLASSSLAGSRSTAMIRDAPASRDPRMAASPTPPQPKTATESPRPTSPVYMAAPSPAITPQPRRPATSGRARPAHHATAEEPGPLGPRPRVDLGGLACRHEGLLGERPDAERGAELH